MTQNVIMKIVLIVFSLAGFIAADAYASNDIKGVPYGKKSDYTGSEACGKCHMKVYKVWKKSKLARAMEVLGPRNSIKVKMKMGLDPYKDYTRDAECVKCHTTGFELKGDSYTFSEYGIGCEACHGPGTKYSRLMKIQGRNYKREKLEKVGLITDFTDNCKKCHNVHSPVIGPDYIFNEKEKYQGIHGIIKLKYHEKIERFFDEEDEGDEEDKKYETHGQ